MSGGMIHQGLPAVMNGRGGTYYGPDGSIDTSAYGGTHLEGMLCVVANTNPADLSNPRNARPTFLMIVRNVSGVTLLPKRAVAFQSGQWGKRVDGYTAGTAARVAGIVDDHLPAAGVRHGDLFTIVVGGECLVITPDAGNAFIGDWAVGEHLYSISDSASTSNTTTASTDTLGRLQRWNGTHTATATTDGTGTNIILHRVGTVLSAATTAETHTDKLVNVELFKGAA